MSTEIKVPPLPESVSEATVVNWHKQPGDPVKREENLVDLETDKVVLEVPAPADGVMGDIKKSDGDTVTAGEVLALLEEGKGEPKSKPKSEPKSEDKDKGGSQDKKADDGAEPPMSPAVRRLLEENDLSPSDVEGSGKGGRITKDDVTAHLESAKKGGDEQPAEKKEAKAEPEQKAAPEAKPEGKRETGPVAAGERAERRVPMTRLRQRIAERLVSAQSEAAMLTTFNEIDMQPVMEMRNRYKDKFQKENDVKLGFMSFFVKASIEALKKFPAINASIDGTDIIYHGYYDIGIAVSSPRGLVVPILRDADAMSFSDIEKTIGDMGVKAKDGKLSIDELTGGTFSITNGGVFGSMLSTPILNPPQSAILGMHATKERPVVVDGKVEVRPVMYVALTYDHRIVDGKEAVQFLVTIKDMIEDPARMLLSV